MHTIRPLVPRVYLPTFLASFGEGMLIPTLPLYLASLGVNYTLVTLAVAMMGFGTLAANVPTGLLLTRISERRAMIAGVVLFAAGGLLLAVAPFFALILVVRAVAGVGAALWGISRMAYMVRTVPIEHRGRAMSFFGGINRIAVFMSPAIGGALATVSFQLAFLVAGLVMAAAVLPVLVVEERLGPPVRYGGRQPGWREIVDVFRHHTRDLLTAGLGLVFTAMIRSGRQVVVPLFAADTIGLDAAAVGVAVSASAAVDMTLFPVAGYLMDRWGRRFAIVPSFLIFGLAMGVLPLARDFTGLLIVTMLIGLGNGIGSGTMLTMGSDLAPQDNPGAFLGVWRLIGDSGHTAGTLVVGAVSDLIGLAMAPFFLAAIGLAGALTFGVLVRETLVKPEPAVLDSA